MKNLEREVEKLKRESDELKARRESKTNNFKQENVLNEKKTVTEFLSSNQDRVQAIKHVTTSFKPEYLSLEEV